MIGRLRGILAEKQAPWLLMDVQGVGYEVEAPMSTFYKLPDIGKEVSLFIHLTIREDAHLLYGFHSEPERKLFRALLKVNGVGPKMALGILSGIESDAFVCCIQGGDTAQLTRIPGVGKKTAERLIVEMRDRLTEWGGAAPGGEKKLEITSAADDAVSALIALGYKPQEASRWVRAVAEDGLSSEALIRRALKAAM
ncbi:MAG: Holliday junction branch migration protein RuvA [Gammaproteobacteria bacterium]|nr:Holliday junction branch migration protein RuvA [Gammaproteobacteria bacterium]